MTMATAEQMAQDANAEATAANQRNSPLLRLPAELRNLVYRYALGDRTLILSTRNRKTLRLRRRDTPAFSLLAVCTQIHSEAALLPYSLNTFDIALESTANTFLATVPLAYVQAIKKLDVGTSFVLNQKATCANLQRFTGLEEVMFGHQDGKLTLRKRYPEEAWEKVVKLLWKRMPDVRSSMRASRDTFHVRENAFELVVWGRRSIF